MNPSRMAASVVHTLEHLAAEKRIELRNDIPGDAVYVLGDVDRLSQVLTNLVDNAIKFTSYQGRITITAHTSAKRWARHRCCAAARSLGAFAGMETHQPEEGSISSSRCVTMASESGLPTPSASSRSSVRWATCDRQAPGTGLGLAISGGIVMQHGGACGSRASPTSARCSRSRCAGSPGGPGGGGPRSTPKSVPNAAPEIVGRARQRSTRSRSRNP